MPQTIELFGYSINVSKEARNNSWPLPDAIVPPVLNVILTKNMPAHEERARRYRSRMLLGEDFVLDYPSQTLWFPASKRKAIMEIKNAGPQRIFDRTILFCIALLAERLGPAVVATPSTRHVLPLYLHASAVATACGALVFCGRSTFGKSTISGEILGPIFPQLDDDQVTMHIGMLNKKKRAPRVLYFGRRRELSTAGSELPLAGLFWLQKSAEFKIEEMDQAEAASLMLSPLVNRRRPIAILNRLRIIRALLTKMPCRRLYFAKEQAPLVELLRANGYA